MKRKKTHHEKSLEEGYFLISGRCGNCFTTWARKEIEIINGEPARCKCGGELSTRYSKNKRARVNYKISGFEIEQPKFLRDVLGKDIEN